MRNQTCNSQCRFRNIDIEVLSKAIADNLTNQLTNASDKPKQKYKVECHADNCELQNVDLGRLISDIQARVMHLFCENISNCCIDDYVNLVLNIGCDPLDAKTFKR